MFHNIQSQEELVMSVVNRCMALKNACDVDDKGRVVSECCDLLKDCLCNTQATLQNTHILSGQSGTQPFDECLKSCENFCNQPHRVSAGADAIDPNTVIQLVQLAMQVISWFRSRHPAATGATAGQSQQVSPPPPKGK
jgi:hypothetical protein